MSTGFRVFVGDRVIYTGIFYSGRTGRIELWLCSRNTMIGFPPSFFYFMQVFDSYLIVELFDISVYYIQTQLDDEDSLCK